MLYTDIEHGRELSQYKYKMDQRNDMHWTTIQTVQR